MTACLLGIGASSGSAATQSLQVTAAPNAQATRPVAIMVTGQVGIPSLLAIYAQAGGGACATQAADEGARGAALVDKRQVANAFSFAVSFTPPSAGTYFLCTYLDGASPGTTEHQNQAFAIAVAAPPATTSPPPTTLPTSVPLQRRACVVPTLRHHTLRGAQHLLAVANCKLGRVYLPSAAVQRAARRRAHGRTPALVVVSQTPAAATVRVSGYTVAVRLAFRRAPRSSAKSPTR